MTEADLESCLIQDLEKQNYIYRKDIKDVEALNQNFREHLESRNQDKLNGEPITDKEFANLLDDIIDPDVFKCSETLREQYALTRENGEVVYLNLFNNEAWCANDFEFINQFVLPAQITTNRFDVIILINGLPLVHIELKRYNINPRKALEQVARYKTDNRVGIATSLFCFTQIFILASEQLVYYTVNNDIKEFRVGTKAKFLPVFTWSDKKNNQMASLLEQFTPTFLEKCFLSKMIARFTVLLKAQRKLMILRPYQVHAVEAIIEHLQSSSKNGYIWHTTGSGKTLTSFKCATILRDLDEYDKIVFVVDRKDLDKQTVDEFNKFEEGCVDKNNNTNELIKRITSIDIKDKVLVTTIQKLTKFLEMKNDSDSKKRLDNIKDKNIVFIFDECHRSQFGKSNKLIRDTFKNNRMIGFTGTPIFDTNSSVSNILVKGATDKENIKGNVINSDNPEGYKNPAEKLTTKHIFDDLLHTYLIKDAIDDKNVLPFHVDYFEGIEPNTPKEARQKIIVQKILEIYQGATVNNEYNAIFAVSSIKDAIAYYKLFSDLQKASNKPLSVVSIFSPPPSININSNILDDCEDEQKDYDENRDKDSERKGQLQSIIDDYNKRYKTSFDINTNFDSYYDDVSQRVKNHNTYKNEKKLDEQINILLVVDMFLTGFDSPHTNSLFVDKELKYHGLIQAFSRTNRIVNDTKPHGNIYCFSDLKERVRDAIVLFSADNSEASPTIWLVKDINEVKSNILECKKTIENVFDNANLKFMPSNVVNLNPIQKREFVEAFKQLQKNRNAISQYIEYDDSVKQQINSIMSEETFGALRMHYLQIATIDNKEPPKVVNGGIDEPDENIDYQLELFATDIIDWDYIVNLVNEYLKSGGKKQKLSKDNIVNMIKSDPVYSHRSDLIGEFIDHCEANNFFRNVTEEETFVELDRFAKHCEGQAWKSLLKNYDVDIAIIDQFRSEYDKYPTRQLDRNMLKEALNLGGIGLLKRVVIQDEFIERVENILTKYHVRKEK